MGKKKKAQATIDTLRNVFTLPESDDSTLARLDREISENLLGFLRDRIVAGDIAPANLEKDFLDTNIPKDPMFVSEQTEFLLENVVSQSVHTWSPSFIGHMTSAIPYFMLPLAKIMMALNQNLVKIETSKAFTPLERQVIGMLHRLVYGFNDDFYAKWTQDFHHSIGTFCSGGTVANITGLWVARNRMLPTAYDEGLISALRERELEGLAVLVSRRGHYSLKKATDILGLGRKHLIAVPVDSRHKADIAAMRETALELKKKRFGLVGIVGVAGTTETGNVDDLDALANVAEEVGCHFHVDAAWGGPTLFSSKYKSLLKGIERADSVTIDAHKQLYVPVGSGICLFKDPNALESIETNAQYIIRAGSRDIGKHTLEGSRPGMAMLVHSALRIFGQRGYELLIDLGIDTARKFAEMIKSTPDFEVVTDPELNLLTYRYLPPIAKQLLEQGNAETRIRCNEILSDLVESIQKFQRARGKTFVSRTRFEAMQYGGDVLTVFRVVLANPLTTHQILREILEEQRGYAQNLMEEEGHRAALEALATEGMFAPV